MADATETQPLLKQQAKPNPPARRSGKWCRSLVSVLLIALLVAAITLTVVMTADNGVDSDAGFYHQAAVVSDTSECSEIGVDVMKRYNGSAVDAAIATVLCIGVMSPAASGIGGGHFMTIYDSPRGSNKKELITINAREMAPLAATKDMFQNVSSSKDYRDYDDPLLIEVHFGGLAVAVPGEVQGLRRAWEKFGRAPWRVLLEPTIRLCRQGVRVTRDTAKKILTTWDVLDRFPDLKAVLSDVDGNPLLEGSLMKRPLLAKTLTVLARDPDSFYTGQLAKNISQDLQDADAIITEDDLQNYKVKIEPPVTRSFRGGKLLVHAPPVPSGGPILNFMLAVLDGYNWTKTDDKSPRNEIETYHKLLETFKFAYAMRSYLGDDDFVDISQAINNMTSQDFIANTRHRITSDKTHPVEYYGGTYAPPSDHGTAHVSVLSPDGAAVAITTSINTYFGSLVYGKRTGIIFNNQMDDFSSPFKDNDWDVAPSPANYIAGHKRPLSSMTPTIVTTSDGRCAMATGGAGGSMITTGVAFTLVKRLLLGYGLAESINEPRIHHQLLPDEVVYERLVQQGVLDGLVSKGHELDELSGYGNVIHAVENGCHLSGRHHYCVEAVGDGRRQGAPKGF